MENDTFSANKFGRYVEAFRPLQDLKIGNLSDTFLESKHVYSAQLQCQQSCKTYLGNYYPCIQITKMPQV